MLTSETGKQKEGNDHRASRDYARMKAIERRALQSESMGLCLGAACKLSSGANA
jgi:hypothetical protein